MIPDRKMRTLYTLILTQSFSIIGSQVSLVAVSFWVIQDTKNATPFAFLVLCMTLPSALIANVAGVFADRWDRRHVMALADSGQALGSLLLLISFLSGSFSLWQLYIVTIIQSVFGAFQNPAFSASVTMLAPDAKRDRVNALQEIGARMAGVIAPAVAGMVYVVAGVEMAFLIDLTTFVAAIVVVLKVHIPRPAQTAAGKAMQGSFWQETLAGWRFLWSLRLLFWYRIYVSVALFFLSLTEVLLFPYLLYRTGSETEVGILSSILQGGAVGAGFLMMIWGGTRPRIHTIMPGFIAFGISMALIGIARTVFSLAILLPVLMFPGVAVRAILMAFFQAKIPADLQGRVFSAMRQLSLLMMSLMFVIAGYLADTVFEPAVGEKGWERFSPLVGTGDGAGIGLMFVIGGVAVALLTLVVYAVPAIRHIEFILPDHMAEVAADNTGCQEPEAVAV